MPIYHLTSQLAQQIVDKTMKIMNINVNVINIKGQIIGSGDLDRLGELHEGAVLALSQQRVVIIDDALAQSLHGVRPGINLPLKVGGEIIGVIGLTGEPEQIRQFGELVCMSAEMMLEQAVLLNELAKKNRLKEELVLNLIQSKELTSRMIEWAKRLEIDIDLPRIAFIVEVDSNQLDIDVAINELKLLQDYLLSMDKAILFAMQSFSQLVILFPTLNKRGVWDIEEQKKRINKIINRNKKFTQLKIKTALGNYFPEATNNSAQSYQSAQATMMMGKRRLPDEHSYYYHDLILPVLLRGLNTTWQAGEFFKHLSILKKNDPNGLLEKTLKAWFKHDLQMNMTANALFIHRNTLEYRLKKISTITHLNLDKLDDRILIYIALNLETPIS